jgi:hypothetical protein
MSRNLLVFLLSSSAENLVRLEDILERRRLAAASREYTAILTAMVDLCANYRRHYLAHRPTIHRLLEGAQLPRVEELALKTLLRNCINTFLTLHELLLFLPRESLRKEMQFFAQSLFGPKYSIRDLSIILTSLYNAFEYSLDVAIRRLDVFMTKVPDAKKLTFGHVMELAIVDRDNPLSWGVLAHEFGHYLDEKHSISSALAAQFVTTKIRPPSGAPSGLHKLFRDLASEIFADLTAYYLLGPICVLPVVNMELDLGLATDKPMPFDRAHPLTITRVTMVEALAAGDKMRLEFFSPYLEALREDDAAKCAQLGPAEKTERDDIDRYVNYFIDEVKADLLARLGGLGLRRFGSVNLQAAVELKPRLEAGVPIGARRKASEKEVRRKLKTLAGGRNVAESRGVFDLLREDPASVAEVVTAGWVAKCEKKSRVLVEAFSHKMEADVFPYLSKVIQQQDMLLMKSIEIISVISGEEHDSAGH